VPPTFVNDESIVSDPPLELPCPARVTATSSAWVSVPVEPGWIVVCVAPDGSVGVGFLSSGVAATPENS
jgi:hypothetical protein